MNMKFLCKLWDAWEVGDTLHVIEETDSKHFAHWEGRLWMLVKIRSYLQIPLIFN